MEKVKTVTYRCPGQDGDYDDGPHLVTMEFDEPYIVRFESVCPAHGERMKVYQSATHLREGGEPLRLRTDSPR